ncbi:hypothetical protein NA57DRAFT_42592 [Rhizodiscina lignyota]|uniref:U3 small nucleolar RNA-associated protein 6 N-terminal domain-containing protein n=1 Tax=Rhizodiscina lignyota TaxID=1504668 RepID=A0A9P4M6H8_9PEZI|nr:hypothetical protein NA57DRAFT_42592 [Rhizodiscina lignyota]
MAATSDKARFYLEQSIPELQEYERKNIFNKVQITAITKQRSQFEHLLNSRDASPSLYARYATYEMNLDLLRRKRIKRLGVKSPLHSGQRRIYNVLERATKKFYGDLSLWMQYIEYARQCKANKKVEELLTRCLRLHPTKPDLWVFAANYALEHDGDIKAARGYMQRGLRFCESNKMLWVEYGKLEMIYVAKIAARRRILGLDGSDASAEENQGRQNDMDADTIALPALTAEDINPRLAENEATNEAALQHLESAPVLTGAIPIAVFDAAMKQFGNNARLAQQFFDTFAKFAQVPSLKNILQHILDSMHAISPDSLATLLCEFKMPIVGLAITSPELPAALGQSINSINRVLDEMPAKKNEIVEDATSWMLPLEREDQLDESLKKVISASVRRYMKTLDQAHFLKFIRNLESDRRTEEAVDLLRIGMKHFGTNEELLQMQSALGKPKG